MAKAASVLNWLVVLIALAAVVLQFTLPYRIGPDEFSRYQWANRLTVVALVGALTAASLVLRTRRGGMLLAVSCGLILVQVLTPRVNSGPNPDIWCYLNLRRIESAKERIREENHLPPGAVISLEQIRPLIDTSVTRLKCYEGGRYIVGAVGEEPKCSIHGTVEVIEARWKSATNWYKLTTPTNQPH